MRAIFTASSQNPAIGLNSLNDIPHYLPCHVFDSVLTNPADQLAIKQANPGLQYNNTNHSSPGVEGRGCSQPRNARNAANMQDTKMRQRQHPMGKFHHAAEPSFGLNLIDISHDWL
jgi:hypothetical protein